MGGWTLSKHFSSCSATAELRQQVAKRLVDWVTETDMDGVDLDWEYPGVNHNGNSWSEDDSYRYPRGSGLQRRRE